jgi:Zn-dependent protease
MRTPVEPAKPNPTTLLALGAMSLLWITSTQNSVGSAAALLATLALNQAGHSFAMRGFGYRNRSMLFIPFYGSISTGTKEDATPTQRAIVQLMGPLPGIVLGTVLSFTAARMVPAGHFLQTLVPVLLLLNLFQLLPLPSFTGGELLRLLLTRRSRWIDFAFRSIVGVILVFAALKWELFVVAAFTVLSLIRLPAEWRVRVAADDIRKRFGALSPLATEVREEALRAIYDYAEVLSVKGPAAQRDARRLHIAREILRLASEESPSVGASAAILGSTSALFAIGSLAFVLFSMWQRSG